MSMKENSNSPIDSVLVTCSVTRRHQHDFPPRAKPEKQQRSPQKEKESEASKKERGREREEKERTIREREREKKQESGAGSVEKEVGRVESEKQTERRDPKSRVFVDKSRKREPPSILASI